MNPVTNSQMNSTALLQSFEASSLHRTSQAVRQSQGLPFASLISEAIQGIDADQKVVAADAQQLVNGNADNLQAIAANVAKADLSFRFLLEMRDKLIASYQEVMRMQV